MRRIQVQPKFDGYDVATVAGSSMLFAGLWLLSPAVALIVVGAMLLVMGTAGALIKGTARARGSR
jgi:hypothetical protein